VQQRVDDAGIGLDHEGGHAEHEEGRTGREGGSDSRGRFELGSGHP
jgi:hypothetical protein